MKVELGEAHLVLHASYRDNERCAEVPGAKWRDHDGVWHAPLSWPVYCALWGIFGSDVRWGDDVIAWAQEYHAAHVAPALLLREAITLPPGFEGPQLAQLRDYQRVGSMFLDVGAGGVLAEPLGSGKTIEAIAALEMSDAYPALVVCPNTVKFVWREEYAKFAPHRDVCVLDGGTAQRRKQLTKVHDVYVTNWESLRNLSRLAPYGSIRLSPEEKKPKELNHLLLQAVIADEAHRAKDPQSKQTRALWSVAHGKSVRTRIALTGTPIANAPDDLWSLLHFVDPESWPSRSAYVNRYCALSYDFNGGLSVTGIRYDTATEFHAAVNPSFRRMPIDVILPELPPVVNVHRFAELGQKQRRAYEQMRKDMIAELDNGDVIVSASVIARLTRLVQFASAYAELTPDGLRLSEPSCKINALMEYQEDLEGEPFVVFAMSRQLIELAAARFTKAKIPHGLITGSIKLEDRALVVRDFQEAGLRAVLATVGAGGTGITLTRAKHACFMQRDWSMVNNVQAEGRIRRIGSEVHDSITYTDIIAKDTVDQRMQEVYYTKQERLEEVTQDKRLVKEILG